MITGKAPGFDTLDVSASVRDVPGKDWSLQAGVRNAFKDRVTYLLALPNATVTSGFVPRSTWVRISRKF